MSLFYFIQIITITVSVLLGFFLFGFIGIFLSESKLYKYVVKETDSSKASTKHHPSANLGHKETIKELSKFFDIILPLEFTYRPWYSKFWIRMLEKHPYIAYLAPAEGRENYTAKKWMCMTFELLNVLFIDSIFAPIAAPDADTCGKLTTPSACLRPSSIDLIDPLCEWDEEYNICVFREIEQNMGVIIIAVLIIKLVEFPLMTLCEYLVDQVGSPISSKSAETTHESSAIVISIYSPRPDESPRKDFLGEEHSFTDENELHSAREASRNKESRQALIRLAARLEYLKYYVDVSTVEDEVDHLLTHADFQFKSDVFEDLRYVYNSSNITVQQRNSELFKVVQRARGRSHTVLKELEEKTSQQEKEIYLVKRFIVELLSGVDRWVAERFFFDEVESEISLPYRVFCAVILMLIICGELTYVFLTGVIMGANATRVWLICLAVVVMQGKRQMNSA